MIRLSSIGLLAATAVLASASLRAQTASPPAPPAVAAAAPAIASPADGLPDTPGKATLLRVCSSCHEPGVVAHQRRSESDWHDLVQLMAGNGAQGTDADLAEITRYLAKSFPAGQ